MSDLKEWLCAKDKNCLEQLCRAVERHAAYAKLRLDSYGNPERATQIEWLATAIGHRGMLRSFVSAASLAEFDSLETVYREGGYSKYIRIAPYWEELGLARRLGDAEKRYSTLLGELSAFLQEEGPIRIAELRHFSYIHSAVCAMTNLYGMIPFAQAYDIYQSVTDSPQVGYEQFTGTAVRFTALREECGVTAYQKCFVASEYLDIRIRGGLRRISPRPAYYELISKQGDKPYYTGFDVTELLSYETPGSCGVLPQMQEFTEFLCELLAKRRAESDGILREVCRACREERGINEIFAFLTDAGFVPSSQKAQKMMVRYIMEIKSSVRLRINRGYTINEMRGICYDRNAICSNL